MTTNRAKLAREHAGLSLGQAVKLLGIAELLIIEESDSAFADLAEPDRTRMAELYGVNLEWLTGEGERYDFKAMAGVRGWDEISDHDRYVVAEFAASMPRGKAKTLAEIRNRVIDGALNTLSNALKDRKP
jgi:hypothetical protein